MVRALSAIILVAIVLYGLSVQGGEHPGEHPGREWIEKSMVKDAIKAYVERDVALKGGWFLLWDEKKAHTLRLKFSRYHDKVRYIEDRGLYFMCTDFVSLDDGSTIDVDFWLKPSTGGGLEVEAIKIHKVNNIPRFTYEGDSIKPVE